MIAVCALYALLAFDGFASAEVNVKKRNFLPLRLFSLDEMPYICKKYASWLNIPE